MTYWEAKLIVFIFKLFFYIITRVIGIKHLLFLCLTFIPSRKLKSHKRRFFRVVKNHYALFQMLTETMLWEIWCGVYIPHAGFIYLNLNRAEG